MASSVRPWSGLLGWSLLKILLSRFGYMFGIGRDLMCPEASLILLHEPGPF